MSLLAVIPARGGSKGIPRKNIKQLWGKPLIAWTIEAAKNISKIDRLILSTDDEEIAAIGRKLGVDVPFLRPQELAADDTPAILTALQILELLPEFDEILWLQPTSPLRIAEDINQLIQFAEQQNANSVASVTVVKTNPNWIFQINPNFLLRHYIDSPFIPDRQKIPQAYMLNGSIYWANVHWLQKRKTFVCDDTLGFVMPAERSIDVDTLLDWDWVEFLMSRNK